MNKIEYFFRQKDLELKFVEKTEKIGINKKNKPNGFLTEVSIYKAGEYYVGVKRTGRPQYFLFDLKFNLLVNAYNQVGFLSKLKDMLSPKTTGVECRSFLVNEFIKQQRMLRFATKKEFAQKIGMSDSYISLCETKGRRIRADILALLIKGLGMSYEEYREAFENEIGGFDSFLVHEELQEYLNRVKVDDLIRIRDLQKYYPIKMGLIYRYAKITSEEMRENNLLTIEGKVSLKEFDKVYRRFNDVK